MDFLLLAADPLPKLDVQPGDDWGVLVWVIALLCFFIVVLGGAVYFLWRQNNDQRKEALKEAKEQQAAFIQILAETKEMLGNVGNVLQGASQLMVETKETNQQVKEAIMICRSKQGGG